MQYRINSPKVIHQIFDTEVVIVNLESGNYYSVRGAGVELWRRIEEGVPFTGSQTGLTDDQQAETRNFLDQLEQEQLIVRGNGSAKYADEPGWAGSDWISPTIEKFTDMRDMLLTDPIHDLDESGWPKPGPPDKA